MPAVTKVSKFSQGTIGHATASCAGDVIVNEYFIDLVAGDLTAGKMYDVGVLPAYHKVVDMILVPDDLDTNGAPTISLDVGLLSGTVGDAVSDRTIGNEFFNDDIGARTGAVSRMSLPTGFRVKPTETDRSIGVKIEGAAATGAAGRVRLLCFMAPADHNVTF